MSDVKNAAYAIAIAMVISTVILSVSMLKASENLGAITLARNVQTAGGTATAFPTSTPFARPTDTAVPTAPAAEKPTINLQAAPSLGSDSAQLVVVEYTDLECPFCGRHHTQTYTQLKTEYVDTGKVKYYYKHFPLDSIHPDARKAAEAAVCAQKQGKAIEFIDKAFNNQQALSLANLKQYGRDVGVADGAAFDSCLDGGQGAAQVEADYQEGLTNGISGTPSFFILKANGDAERIVGAQPYSVFKPALDRALAG